MGLTQDEHFLGYRFAEWHCVHVYVQCEGRCEKECCMDRCFIKVYEMLKH